MKPVYKSINGVWAKQTAYERQSGEWVLISQPDSYGVEWDYSQSGTTLTRIEGAAGFASPIPATSLTGTGSSPFDTVMPWAGMKRYVINSAGTIKEFDEMLSGDVMVYIPKFYYRVEKDETNKKMRWKIAAEPLDGFSLHPGSGRYIGRYHTSNLNGVYSSASGLKPVATVTRATVRTNSHTKGDYWWMLDFATWNAVRLLYLVEFANWNSQSVLGKGLNTGSAQAVGGTDSAVYHTISRSGASQQYRWIEDIVSNVRNYVDGYLTHEHRAYIGTDNEVFTDTVDGLTDTGIAVSTTGGAYIKEYALYESAPWAFIPAAVGGSATTYVPDQVISTTTTNDRLMVSGADYAGNNAHGLFLHDTNEPITFTAATVGSRLIYIPPEELEISYLEAGVDSHNAAVYLVDVASAKPSADAWNELGEGIESAKLAGTQLTLKVTKSTEGM